MEIRGKVFKIGVSIEDVQLASLYDSDDDGDDSLTGKDDCSDADCVSCKPFVSTPKAASGVRTVGSSIEEFSHAFIESQSMLVRRDALSLEELVGGGGQVLHVGGAVLLIGWPEEAVTRRDVVGADHPVNVGLELWERQIFCQNELELALVDALSPISRGSTSTFPDDSGLLNEGSLCVDLSSFGPLPCFPANFLSVETDSCTPKISVLPHNRGEKKGTRKSDHGLVLPKKKGESKSPRQRTRLTRKSRDLRDEINEAMLCHSTDFGFDSFSSGSEMEEDGCLEDLITRRRKLGA